MYNPYLISPDSFWVGQKTTWLLKSTYRYVLVHTGMYKLGILVLTCTVLYWYVLVHTSTYHFAQSCPGVQDSRWSYPELYPSWYVPSYTEYSSVYNLANFTEYNSVYTFWPKLSWVIHEHCIYTVKLSITQYIPVYTRIRYGSGFQMKLWTMIS